MVDKEAKNGNMDEILIARKNALMSLMEKWYDWRDAYWKNSFQDKKWLRKWTRIPGISMQQLPLKEGEI